MKNVHFVMLAAAACLALAPSDTFAQAAKKGAAKMACATKHGKGWAPTEGMARFQAWEIIAQTTGNWPIQSDVFKNESYKCKPDGSGVTCFSKIDVCKAA